MADTKISDLTAITGSGTASGDLFVVVDVSDTTMAASGTDKKITKAEMLNIFEAAGAAAAAQAASQPLDSDLTAIAALSTTTYGRAILTLANQAALMALLSASSDTAQGIVELATNTETATGTDATRAVTPAGLASVLSSYLTTAAAAAGYQPLDSDLTAIAALSTTSYGRAFLATANLAAVQAILGPTGSPSASTYLRGDGSWATPASGSVATDAIFDAKGDIPAGTGPDASAKLTVGSNGTSAIADSNQTTGLKYVGSPRTKAPRTSSQAGYFLPDTISGLSTTSQSGATNQDAVWLPFWLPRRCTPTITVYCWTLEAGSTLRYSTWSNDEATFRPATGGLIEDLGTVSGASTGAKALTCSTAVGPGWVWVGIWQSNHTTVRWNRVNAGWHQNLMGDTNIANNRYAFGWRASGLDYSAAWNSTLPTLSVAEHVSNSNAIIPYLENV